MKEQNIFAATQVYCIIGMLKHVSYTCEYTHCMNTRVAIYGTDQGLAIRIE